MSLISPSSSRSAVSRSLRWVSSSSTCASASAYSSCASGFTGPSCSRRLCEPLQARPQLLATLLSGSGSSAAHGLELQLGRRAPSAPAPSRPPGRETAAIAPRPSSAPRRPRADAIWIARLLLRAGAQLAPRRSPPPHGRVASSASNVDLALADRRDQRLQLLVDRRDRRAERLVTRDLGPQPLRSARRARRARARRARPGPARRSARAWICARRSAPGPSSGAVRRRSIAATSRRCCSTASSKLSDRRPVRRDRLLHARRRARRASAAAASTSPRGRLLGLDRRLAGRDQLVATVALREHPLLADLRRLPQLTAEAANTPVPPAVTATPAKSSATAARSSTTHTSRRRSRAIAAPDCHRRRARASRYGSGRPAACRVGEPDRARRASTAITNPSAVAARPCRAAQPACGAVARAAPRRAGRRAPRRPPARSRRRRSARRRASGRLPGAP